MSRKGTRATEKIFYATGRRKTASGRAYLTRGEGKITVIRKGVHRSFEDYFVRRDHRIRVLSPLRLIGMENNFDIRMTVWGGGITGQTDAACHAIARALLRYDDGNVLGFKALLKKAGFLTRDDRKVERKKTGQPGARKKMQFSKR